MYLQEISMSTPKDLESQTSLTVKMSTVEKGSKKKKKTPYEVPPKKMEPLMHKSKFKPPKEKKPKAKPEEGPKSKTPEVKVPAAELELPEVPATEPEVPKQPEVPRPEVLEPEMTKMDESVEPKVHRGDIPVAPNEWELSPEEPSVETTPGDHREDYYTEYYVNGYCMRNDFSKQYYARDETGHEYYWRDSVGAQIYAHQREDIDGKINRIEYPAMKEGLPVYITDREGKPRFPVNLYTQAVVFPRNPETGEEMYLTDKNGEIFYPENKFGQQFYRKDLLGNDVPINNTYAQFANGSQIYPVRSNGDQFYLKRDTVEVPAVRRKDDKMIKYYAQKVNGDEIYPRMFLEEEELDVMEE